MGNRKFDFKEASKALVQIKREREQKEFNEACRPLIKYLAENHHPHIKVIVHSTGAEMLEGVKTSAEILDYLRD